MTNQTNRIIAPHGGYRKLKSYQTTEIIYDLTVEFCKTYTKFLAEPETAANTMICLIHQANYLLDQQLRALEKEFLEHGGFTERLYAERKKHRGF